MLHFLLLLLVLIVFAIGIYLELQYAYAGYPNEWRWRVILFAVGGFVVSVGGYLIMTEIDGESVPPIIHLFAVIFGGVLFAWVFPVRMRYVIPPKQKRDL